MGPRLLDIDEPYPLKRLRRASAEITAGTGVDAVGYRVDLTRAQVF